MEDGQIPDDEDISVDVNPACDEDLYGDLYDDEGGEGETLLKEKNRQLEEKVRESEKEIGEKKEKIEELDSQVERLQEENSTLIRNISCLYKTAKKDASRRDAEVKEMRKKLTASLTCPACNPLAKGKGPHII
mmetsp:Transcript_30554/g.51484  ORF Transcript_30554/g.51484 Transcript_30554/m.51484 type:complete len:133 (-) Transcript_30554:172-570(-)